MSSEPFVTSAPIETRGIHDRVRVFVRHQLAGELVVSRGDGALLQARLLFGDRNDESDPTERPTPVPPPSLVEMLRKRAASRHPAGGGEMTTLQMLLRQLRSWWRRPPEADRILVALLVGSKRFEDEMPGLEIQKIARCWTGSPYAALSRLQETGLVESREAAELTVYMMGGTPIRRRLYRLTEAGRRRALEVPSW